MFILPCQATTVALPPGKQGSGQACSSCLDWAPLHGWWNLAPCQMMPHQATDAHVTSIQTHVHAIALSHALGEEGELVCNKVTPVG